MEDNAAGMLSVLGAGLCQVLGVPGGFLFKGKDKMCRQKLMSIVLSVFLCSCDVFASQNGAAIPRFEYQLLSIAESGAESGFWTIELNEDENAVNLPGLYGAGLFCSVDSKFYCVESEVLAFAVPKAFIGRQWRYGGLLYKASQKKAISVLGVDFLGYVIHAYDGDVLYATYLYSKSRGLVAFSLNHRTSFYTPEFYILRGAMGFGRPK